jgi:polysaccharide export outer membrane protein
METQKTKIIILDDDAFFGNLLKNFLYNQEYRNIELYQNEDKCIDSIKNESMVVILDHHLEKSTGLDVMKEIQKKNPDAYIIYLSGQEYMHIAVKALRSGAIDYIEKNGSAFYQLKTLIDQIMHGQSNVPHLNYIS